MLTARLQRLRRRLDALGAGTVEAVGLWGRVRARFDRERAPELPCLAQLDRELDRVGLHTSADAWLLRSLGLQEGRAGALVAGLAARTREVLREFERELRRAERSVLSGRPVPGATVCLERWFPALARAVRITELFAQPDDHEPPFEILSRAGWNERPPEDPRLAIAGVWAGRARGSATDGVQKRRALDAAHALLLRVEPGADRARLHRLRLDVAEARERAHATPLPRTLSELIAGIRGSARGDLQGAYRSLRALYEGAVEASDLELARAAHRAAAAFFPPTQELKPLIRGLENEVVPGRRERSTGGADAALVELAFQLDPERLSLLALALGCARYFDVEAEDVHGQVEPDRRALRPVERVVPYPTQMMIHEPGHPLQDPQRWVIGDPRMLLYDLASGRQRVRAYLEPKPPLQPRGNSVRVYVCDASGSMHGPRSRLRDAIVIAELNDLRRRAIEGKTFAPLYFSFFTTTPTELIRVDSAERAAREIERLFAQSPATGRTDITSALVAAFEAIRTARGMDPYLARATVVLVTDGEDGVDVEAIHRARAPLGGLEIALSFISLGGENAALRDLVLEQRARGRRAFYHHLSDAELASAPSDFDAARRTLLPREVPLRPGILEQLRPHLDALEALARRRSAPRPAVSRPHFDALFPRSEPVSTGGVPHAVDVARGRNLLEAIAEAAALAPADDRAAECIELVLHLLELYGWTVPRYLEVLRSGDARLRAALDQIRLMARPA